MRSDRSTAASSVQLPRCEPHHVVTSCPDPVVVEVHGTLGDYLLAVGAGHLAGEVVCGVVPRSQLVPGRDSDARVLGNRDLIGRGGAVAFHVGEGNVGRLVARVLQAEVGVKVGATCSFREVEGG